MRKKLTDKGIAALKARADRYAFPDPELRGHYVRVQPSGAKSFVTVARDPTGKQVWTTIGAVDVMAIADAREKAREAIRRVREGLPALEAPPVKADSFEATAEQWLKRHVGERSASGGRSNPAAQGSPTSAWKDRASSISAAATSPPCSMKWKTITVQGSGLRARDRPWHRELVRDTP